MRVSILCEPAPIAGRLNEDACVFWSDEHSATAAAIDGATQRVDVPALYAAPGDGSGAERVTGARFAAQLTRRVLFQNADRDPAAMLLAAYTALRAHLERVGAFDAAALARLAPQHAVLLAADPRLIRLMLPACVATVVTLDLRTRAARFAHVGDTALFVFHTDGRVSQPTTDQVRQHDEAALAAARAVQAEEHLPHLADVVRHTRVVRINQHNGLYHNYVDERGTPDPSVGVGVIDGLPEMRAYMQTGTVDLTPAAGLLVCSDGFLLPAPWRETPEQAGERLRTMRDLLFAEGIAGYAAHLRRVQASDPHLDRFPRFKQHDDTSAIFVELDRT